MSIRPDADSPAFDVAAARTLAPYEDEAALIRFAEAVDVVTYEFENVPGATARDPERPRARWRPNAQALAVSQDRLAEKSFVAGLGIPVAPFADGLGRGRARRGAAPASAGRRAQDPPLRL